MFLMSFNPGVDAAGALRNPTRFAPIRDRKGRVVPYLYGGSSLDCAIFETVFHNVPADAPDKFVDLNLKTAVDRSRPHASI